MGTQQCILSEFIFVFNKCVCLDLKRFVFHAILFLFLSLVDSVALRLDDCTFHESVDLTNFESTRTLLVNPPEGEVWNCFDFIYHCCCCF